ncbi:hypothetical protein [Bacillus sp. FJAT-22090]|uniref:hypothetical protein n=1 Tax=Bacillus sp. FJAT-22090 TaxID=1581038 RepID=UPI0011A4230E|nr:hypothetical protein [Bacillus sp. FJAT-22090]
MKTISLNFTWMVLGFLVLILLTPSLAAAEEHDSNPVQQIEVNVLDNEPEKATILDVEVNGLLGVDHIDIEIPDANDMQNSVDEGNMKEKLVNVIVEDEEVGNIEADVLSLTESPVSSEKAVVDLTAGDPIIADDLTIEVLGQEEMATDTAYSNESSVVNLTAEDSIIADDLTIEVLGQEEMTTDTAYSNESSVVDLTAEDPVIAEDLTIEVLGQEEMATDTAYSNESSIVNLTAEDPVIAEDLTIEVLGQGEMATGAAYSNESSLVDLTAEDPIIADDLTIEVLGQEEMATDTAYSNENSVVDLKADDSVIADDLTIEVLGQEEMATNTAYSNESSVVVTELAPNIIAEQLELDVLADKKFMVKNGTSQETMDMEEGLDLELSNVPIVETVHVGVLENNASTVQEGYTESSSFLTVTAEDEGANSLLGDLELHVLPTSDFMEDGLYQTSSSVASLETVDGLVEDLSANVLLTRSTLSGSTHTSDSGVVELVGEQFAIADQMHVGILDSHEMYDMDEQYRNRGVLQLDLVSDPLDDLTIDILTNNFQTNSDGSSRKRHGVSLGVANDLIPNTNISILESEEFVAAQPTTISNGSEKSLESSFEEMEENTGEASNENETPGEVVNEDISVYEDENTIVSINTNANPNTNESMEEIVEVNTNAETTNTDEEEIGMLGNLNDVSFNGNGMQNASMLPKTGGFFDGMLLMLLALSLLASGLTIRKFA